MKRSITNEDKLIVTQNVIEIRCKIEIYDEITGDLVDYIEGGLIDGNSSINSDSAIRRTFNMTLYPNNQNKLKIAQDGDIWINKIIKLQMGIKDMKSREYVWWSQGFYTFKNATANYNATTNTLSLSCTDMMSKLDGSMNGQIGDPIIKIDSAEKSPDWKKSDVYDKDNKYCMRDYKHFVLSNAVLNAAKISERKSIGDDPIKENTEYNILITYEEGDIALHNNKLYKCLATTKGDWDETKWEETIKHWDETKLPYVISYNTISNSLLAVARDYANLKKIEIDDIGEYKAMSEYNPANITENPETDPLTGYKKYREESKVMVRDGSMVETWNIIPYDLSFSSGCTILSIMQQLIDLYPNYEHYFDIYGNYCASLIPSSYNDYISLDYDFIKSVLISENTSIDLTSVKNIQIIYGKSFTADWYTDGKDDNPKPIYENNTYIVNYTDYGDTYINGDTIAFVCPEANKENSKFYIPGVKNTTGEDHYIEIYNENTEKPLEAGVLEKNKIYTFKIKIRYIANDDGEQVLTARLYYLGCYQAQALSALVANTEGIISECRLWNPFTNYLPGDYSRVDDETYRCLVENNGIDPSEDLENNYWTKSENKTLYDEQYFIDKYGVSNVILNVIQDSPFAIQNLGQEILHVNSGNDYDNISSDSLAAERSNYELWKSARLTDNISITTKILPWLDVNVKATYKPILDEEAHQYIVKSISHNWKAGTSEIKMIRFYPLYQDPLIIQTETSES